MMQRGMMTLAPSKSMALQCCLSSGRFLVRQHIPTTFSLPLSRKFLSCSVLASSRTRNFSSIIAAASSSSKRKKKQNLSHNHVKEGEEEEEEEEEEDAFELLFKQLEEDLKNDDMSFDVDDEDDNEITEEDLAKFECELEDALRGDAEMLQSVIDDTEKFKSTINDTETDNDPVEEADDDDDDGSGKSLKLRNWQLRKLAKALKDGRRKTSIKSLAADVCLDRAVVLELLRDPPPNLLMMSLALPEDEPTVTVALPEAKSTETVQEETSIVPVKPESKAKLPVHVMQHRWSAQKRLKKVQVETLERIYKKTKRPTNTMISSIVHVTNLPRKRVVQWFEDKRAEEGVPDHRSPYNRDVSESV